MFVDTLAPFEELPTPHPSDSFRPGQALRGLAAPSNRESDSHYRDVLRQLSDEYRVIRCSDGIQYILQKLISKKWRAKSYPNTREGLRSAVMRHAPELYAESKAWLDQLPDYITKGGDSE